MMPGVKLVGLALLSFAVAGCPRASGTADGGVSSSEGGGGDAQASPGSSFDAVAIARAEDVRRAKDVPAEARTSHDVAARRRSARALARIADTASVDGLVAHLADEDSEVVSWAAYGLGHACKTREDAHVKMLAARAASLGSDAGSVGRSGLRGTPELDPRIAIARGIGRCGGSLSEQALVSLVKAGGTWLEPALLGLGDLARSRKQINADAMTALLEATTTRDRPPADVAFYALSGRSRRLRQARDRGGACGPGTPG